jgi:hypothetical protein
MPLTIGALVRIPPALGVFDISPKLPFQTFWAMISGVVKLGVMKKSTTASTALTVPEFPSW